MAPDDPLRVNRIENYKEIQEELPEQVPDEKDKNKELIAAAFSAILNKFVPTISGRKKGAVTFENKLYRHLGSIRTHLEKLRKDDQTKNPAFTSALSKEWLAFLAELDKLPAKEPNYPRLCKLVKEVNAFPTKNEHALGYYLRHYAGEKWLPFPYLEILRTFTREWAVHREKSDLGHFLHLLDQILGDEE